MLELQEWNFQKKFHFLLGSRLEFDAEIGWRIGGRISWVKIEKLEYLISRNFEGNFERL
jgi:hypothetical protein